MNIKLRHTEINYYDLFRKTTFVALKITNKKLCRHDYYTVIYLYRIF